LIKNKITLNKVIFVFFIIVIFVTFIFIYMQYKNSKEILINSYINKYAFQSLQIKEKFKNIFDKVLYLLKPMKKQIYPNYIYYRFFTKMVLLI